MLKLDEQFYIPLWYVFDSLHDIVLYMFFSMSSDAESGLYACGAEVAEEPDKDNLNAHIEYVKLCSVTNELYDI